MLRGIVMALALALAAVALALGVLSHVHGTPYVGWPFLVWAVLLLAGTVLERRRYRARWLDASVPGWTFTGERFCDPDTGTWLDVWSDPADGSRHYVRTPQNAIANNVQK